LGLVESKGTLNTTASEQDLANIPAGSTPGSRGIWINLKNLSGNTMEFKFYIIDPNDGQFYPYRTQRRTDPIQDVAWFQPFLPGQGFRATVKRISGADRSIPWFLEVY
jgi:hypothetical protein